jgi:aminoglycoside phosphotransferase (APT) family kinase protein
MHSAASIGRRLRAAFEAGEFAPLGDLYADDALLDWSMPGRRARVTGPEAVVAQLGEWWRGRGELTRWDESDFPSGLTIEFERRVDGVLARQRHFVQTAGDRIVRHQAYCARPLGATEEPSEDVAAEAIRGLGPIDRREPLTHGGQSGTSLERLVLADGRRLVVKRITGEDWVSRVTHDEGREVGLWEQGVLTRMPREIDHAVLDAGRHGRAGWLLMRDVSGELLPPDRRLSREESARILAAAAALHRRFAGESVHGLCSLEDRITLAAPMIVAGEASEVDYLPKMLVVGWEVFADAVPDDVAAAIFATIERPQPLAALLRGCVATLVHNDLRGANLGLEPGRIVVLDWGLAGSGPPELDFAWYLFVNGWRIDATREQLIEDFKRAEGDLHDPRALELAWIAQLCWHGSLLAHELVEASDDKRARARGELAWWVERVRGALELL